MFHNHTNQLPLFLVNCTTPSKPPHRYTRRDREFFNFDNNLLCLASVLVSCVLLLLFMIVRPNFCFPLTRTCCRKLHSNAKSRINCAKEILIISVQCQSRIAFFLLTKQILTIPTAAIRVSFAKSSASNSLNILLSIRNTPIT